MNRIDAKFNELKKKGRTALITYLTAGDKGLDTTSRLVSCMEKNGADLVEIGIPYSDPVADGPVIQRADARVLKDGIRIKDVMECVSRTRKKVDIPLVYLLYLNCILQYGKDRFFHDCRGSGIDAVIVPDLPFEESDEISTEAEKYGIYVITLVAPTSEHRLMSILKQPEGFVYCVSSLGVTGMRSEFPSGLKGFMGKVAELTDKPRAIGFGISTPEQAVQIKDYCEGVIVGSAIVKRIEEAANPKEAEKRVGQFVSRLRTALDGRSYCRSSRRIVR